MNEKEFGDPQQVRKKITEIDMSIEQLIFQKRMYQQKIIRQEEEAEEMRIKDADANNYY